MSANVKSFFISLLIVLGSCSRPNRFDKLEPLSSSSDSEDINLLISEDSIQDISIKESKNPYVIKIPFEPRCSSLDTIFFSYDFIPLESNGKCIIGNVTKILTCKDCYCILDRDNKNVFIFERDGRFRCRLGDIGHGPKEHVDAWNIAYNEKKELLTLLDLSGRKLQHFDLKGNFLGEQSLYLLFTDFEYLNDDIILYTGTSYNKFSSILDLYQLVVTDEAQKPLSRGCKTTTNIRQEFNYSAVFKKYDNKVLYDDLLSDTIWSISRNHITPLIIMDIENKRKLSQYDKQHMTDYLYKEYNKDNTNVLNWFVTPKYISMIYHTPKGGGPVQNLIYSKKSGLSKVIGFNLCPKRLGDYLAKAGFDGVISDNTFLKVVEPYNIIEAINNPEIKNNLTTKELDIVRNLTIDGNPIIMIEKIYDF